jgi:heavy metal sensor kinase
MQKFRMPSFFTVPPVLRSIRWRLTAWYVLLLCGLLLVFSAGTYVAVHKLLLDNLDDLLASQAKLVVDTISLNNRQLTIRNDALRIGRNSDDHLTRLYQADGTRLFDNNPKVADDDLDKAVREALKGKQNYDLISGPESELRVLTFPIRNDKQVVGALQIGLSLEDIEKTMRALLKVMLVLAPAMLLLASGGGLFLANRALSPIDKITRAAQQISAEDFNRRIDLRGPDDEMRRLAYTFDDMIARLQSAFEQQRRFTADASHELRTPLTAMIGQIDVALDRPRDADSYRNTLAAVREQAQRLARMANDLLYLARSDIQPKTNAHELIDLAQLIPAIMAQVEPLAQARDQELRLICGETLPIRGNEDDLIRLFLNLLDNAIRYSPRGAQIVVRCEQRNSQLAISVADTGPGIAPEHLPHLFERFFRVNRGRSRAQGGSGLGLAIAQTIVSAHGGRLTVESKLGQGSTFTALLPRAGAA